MPAEKEPQAPVEVAEEISAEAKKGSYDANTRLRRWVVCERCGCHLKRYVECLKAGEFEISEDKRVLVSYPSYYYLDSQSVETVTPVFIVVKCESCGCESRVTDPVLTVEYLQSCAKRREGVRMWV